VDPLRPASGGQAKPANYDPAQLDALIGHPAMQTLLSFVATMVGADPEFFQPAVTCNETTITLDCAGPLGRIEFIVHPTPTLHS